MVEKEKAMKKYEFTDEVKHVHGITLHRIRHIKTGTLGGWLQSEKNLSQTGKSWVSDETLVFGGARISGNAQVSGKSRVSGNARVSGDARVSGKSWVSGDARVSGKSWVYSNTKIR